MWWQAVTEYLSAQFAAIKSRVSADGTTVVKPAELWAASLNRTDGPRVTDVELTSQHAIAEGLGLEQAD